MTTNTNCPKDGMTHPSKLFQFEWVTASIARGGVCKGRRGTCRATPTSIRLAPARPLLHVWHLLDDGGRALDGKKAVVLEEPGPL